MKRGIILKILGIFLLLWGIAAIINSFYLKNPTQIFYLCYIGLILIGLGILKKDSYLILSQLYILGIPLLVWDIDFLYQFIIKKPLLGITNYMFSASASTIGNIISLQHLFTIPLAIYATHLIGLKRKDAWKLSFIQISLIFLIIVLFTPKESNINCVFKPCINLSIGLPYYVTWFLIFFLMIFLTSLILNSLSYLKSKRK